MLRIDRVTADMDVVSRSPDSAAPAARTDALAVLSDPQAREPIKALVREVLREQLRELERQGVI